MALTGTAWNDPANNGTGLWVVHYKINADNRGFHWSVQIAEKNEADATAIGNDLGSRMKALLPSDAEIFDAILSKSDTAKDGRFLHLAVGFGTDKDPAVAPAPATPSFYDAPRTALLIRLEDTDGGEVTRKWCPIPDRIVTKGQTVNVINPALDPTVALPALPVDGDAYELTFQRFMIALMKQTHHVVANHLPGGVYKYTNFKKAFMDRVGSKKGGRVFIA